jgi:hypothetical protein
VISVYTLIEKRRGNKHHGMHTSRDRNHRLLRNEISQTLGRPTLIAGHKQLLEIRAGIFCKKVSNIFCCSTCSTRWPHYKKVARPWIPRSGHSTHPDATLNTTATTLHPAVSTLHPERGRLCHQLPPPRPRPEGLR